MCWSQFQRAAERPFYGWFPGSSNSKESPALQETLVLSLGQEVPLDEGNDYLENSMDRGA